MRKFATFSKIASWVLTIGVLTLVWLFPVIAYAQEAPAAEPAPGSASELLFMLLKIVFSVLAVLASYLTIKAIKYFEKKTKIDIPATTEKALFDWADQAVGFAHEKSHQVLKKTGKKLDGNEKMGLATNFVMELVKKHKLDEMAETKIKDYIEAKLGTKRLEEPGAPPSSPPA